MVSCDWLVLIVMPWWMLVALGTCNNSGIIPINNTDTLNTLIISILLLTILPHNVTDELMEHYGPVGTVTNQWPQSLVTSQKGQWWLLVLVGAICKCSREWGITLHWLWLATWKLVETKTFDRDMETFRKHFPSVLFAWIRKCKNTM